MHQSFTFSIQLKYIFANLSGIKVVFLSITAFMAGRASGFIFTNHCFETIGSIAVWQR